MLKVMSDKQKLIVMLIEIVFLSIIIVCLAIANSANAEIHDGSIGRIQIPSIRADFDLSWNGSDMNAHQHIALLYKRQGCQQVGNHYGSSGTWKLENVKVGDKAYLEYVIGNGGKAEKHGYKYVCYAVMICDVNHMILSHNGREIEFDSTDLVCVTCVVSDSTRNYVAVFERCE